MFERMKTLTTRQIRYYCRRATMHWVRVGDRYDDAIDALLYADDWPTAVLDAWGSAQSPESNPSAILFGYANERGNTPHSEFTDRPCGCLTQIRLRYAYEHAMTPELTHEIAQDVRIPDDPMKIEPHHLPLFATYRREIERVAAALRAKRARSLEETV